MDSKKVAADSHEQRIKSFLSIWLSAGIGFFKIVYILLSFNFQNAYSKFMEKISHDPLKLKGDKAEQIVHELAQKTFLTDWCYPNPKLHNGKELCDLFIVFDNIAIIMSVKNSKLDTRKFKDGAYKQKDIDKSAKQLKGARRTLLDLKTPVELENPRRGKELFDPKDITEVYLISALMGEEGIFLVPGQELDDGSYVHNFTRSFTEIVLNELDTISDFCEYLKQKELFLRSDIKAIIVEGGEENLLANYLDTGRKDGNRNFDQLIKYDFVHLTDDMWDGFINADYYKKKKKADKISYLWDEIIDYAHTSNIGEYEIIARELARSNRLERRVLSKECFDTFMEAQSILKMNSQKKGIWWRHRISLSIDGNIVYYFMFMPSSVPKKDRREVLVTGTFYAMGFTKKLKVIGIATEIEHDANRSYAYCFREKENWREDDENKYLALKEKYNWFVNTEFKSDTIDEYPN